MGRPLVLEQMLVSGGFWQGLLCLSCEAQTQACLQQEVCEQHGDVAAPSADGLGSAVTGCRRAALG